jgi:hypothetical protein
MDDTRKIHPLTEFVRNHKAYGSAPEENIRAGVLTVNGKPEIVIQDANSYQRMIDRLHHMETSCHPRRHGERRARRTEARRAGIG